MSMVEVSLPGRKHTTRPLSGSGLFIERAQNVPAVRPKVAELAFQVYGRALHPELFEVLQTRKVQRNGFQAKIDITSSGHVVTWRYGGLTLTEVAAASNHPLPEKRRLMSHRLSGTHSDTVTCRGGTQYRVRIQLEPADPEIFWAFQQELVNNEPRQGMLHTFDASGRVPMGAISYIHIETRSRLLLVQAFHTFPDDCAIVKSESRFEIP